MAHGPLVRSFTVIKSVKDFRNKMVGRKGKHSVVYVAKDSASVLTLSTLSF